MKSFGFVHSFNKGYLVLTAIEALSRIWRYSGAQPQQMRIANRAWRKTWRQGAYGQVGTKDVRRREVYWRKRAAKRIKWGLEHSPVYCLPCSSLPNSEKSWGKGDKHHRLNIAWEGLGRSKSRGGVWEDNRRKQGNPSSGSLSRESRACKIPEDHS